MPSGVIKVRGEWHGTSRVPDDPYRFCGWGGIALHPNGDTRHLVYKGDHLDAPRYGVEEFLSQLTAPRPDCLASYYGVEAVSAAITHRFMDPLIVYGLVELGIRNP